MCVVSHSVHPVSWSATRTRFLSPSHRPPLPAPRLSGGIGGPGDECSKCGPSNSGPVRLNSTMPPLSYRSYNLSSSLASMADAAITFNASDILALLNPPIVRSLFLIFLFFFKKTVKSALYSDFIWGGGARRARHLGGYRCPIIVGGIALAALSRFNFFLTDKLMFWAKVSVEHFRVLPVSQHYCVSAAAATADPVPAHGLL